MENCPKCQHVKGILQKLGVEFEERKTAKKVHLNTLTSRGYDHVPILMCYVDGYRHWLPKGFTEANVKRFLYSGVK